MIMTQTWEMPMMLAAVPEWVSTIWSVLLLALGFSLVIFVHELGHFLAAKWAKVRVERFAIGFGKELVGFTRGETRYSLNVLPLGGYVKMLGQEDFVIDKSGELKVKGDPDSFTHKSIGQRMVIISAGVIMNLLFAAVAFAVVVMVGRLQPPAVVGTVKENSPAGRAGLQTGDRILAVNGKEIDGFGELYSAIVLSDPDEVLVLDVERDGRLLEDKPRVLPEFRKDERIRQVGISSGMNRRVHLPSIWPKDEPPEDELRKNDELYKLVLGSEEKEFKDLGVFCRAMVAARGRPVEMIVRRPVDPEGLPEEAFLGGDAKIESREVRVRARAVWAPLSHEAGDDVNGSLLGLVPRLTALTIEPDKSLDRAGMQPGDVVTRIGSNAYPTFATVRQEIESSAGREVQIEVRRPYVANDGLSGRTVAFCCEHREAFIRAARGGVAAALAQVRKQAGDAGLPEADQEKLAARLGALKTAADWRRWLERVDVHKLKPFIPRAPFSLLGKSIPTVDGLMRCLDENHVVVADVLPLLGRYPSPARAAGIPVGSVILAVDGKPVTYWYELCEAFRSAAGRAVELTYRVADEERRARMNIPMCVTAALDIPAGSRIVKINGKDSSLVDGEGGRQVEVALPDWRAVEQLLRPLAGGTATVEYVTAEAEKRAGTYAVEAGNIDPWLMRAQFPESFACYALVERHPVRNPFVAVVVGFRQAYQKTMETILSIKHMLITRQVGLNKVSGPVGIFRAGTRFADSGLLNLLWFLAVISANLAVINFLPMPIVDGGLFLFLVLEKIRGEPVSIKTQVATQLIGIALIATVFILVTYQDIKNWITGA
jgi:membrane-associated protease RseP (regulator of RpoE activity)